MTTPRYFAVLLYKYVAMKSALFVFWVTGSSYVKYTTFLGMELHLPCVVMCVREGVLSGV